jgi:lysophospholipase L1-like esterase
VNIIKSVFFRVILATACAQIMAASAGAQATRDSASTRPGMAVRVAYPRDAFPYSPGTFDQVNPNIPSLIIAGDSTATNGDPQHRGWGGPLIDYFDTSKINIVNRARGGRSSRSFVYEGLWDQVIAGTKAGDYVMIQFGHNDGGNILDPKARAEIPGDGPATRPVTRPDGKIEIVHTFGWYCAKFIDDVRAKGANPVIMSSTVYNRWTDGKFAMQTGDYGDVAKVVALAKNCPFLDHAGLICTQLQTLDQAGVNALFNADHLHTTTPGAVVNAECFIAGIKAMEIKPLVDALNEKGKAIAAAGN